jgi:NADPH:quinone reductase-like Zn-dependent oxidoreductase
MKEVICARLSDDPASAVEVREVPIPTPGAGEVLISMIACPINPADVLLLTGRHFYKPELPALVGIEGAGRVAEVHSSVTTLAVGDLVAVPFGGTWREYMTMKAADVLPLPADVDPLQAAMLSVNPVTAAGLLEGLSAGDWLIQNAANSAVGQLVIRLARRRGIRTLNVVRRAELVAALELLGADVVLLGDDNLAARVAAETGDAPVRRGLDAIAGHAAGRLYQCLGDGGELICYGLLNSDEIVLNAADVVFRDVVVRGYSRLRVLRQMDAGHTARLLSELVDLLRSGALNTPIEAVFPIEQVREALTQAERPGRTGKILLGFSAP